MYSPIKRNFYMIKTTLDKVELRQIAFIHSITNDELKFRMLGLGFVKGTVITPAFFSPASDPVAYRINNITIALRNNEAKYVEVII